MDELLDLSDNWNMFSKNRNFLYSIAIISIIIFHYFEDVLGSSLVFNDLLIIIGKFYNTLVGSVGVEIFVFLSGICLYFSFAKDSNIKHFYHKRIKRILPTYFLVAILFWFLVDLIILKKGLPRFFADLLFVTFITEGTRTFWYVLFILLTYFSYPLVYKVLQIKNTNYSQLIILFILAFIIVLFPKILFLNLYYNIEILLWRFLVFFIGCWCGKKVFYNEDIKSLEKIGILFGLFLMIYNLLPIKKLYINTLNFRFVMCFFGIFLTYFFTKCVQKACSKIVKFVSYVGCISYELYLTHVAVRSFFNIIGLKTYYLYNYILCILISVCLVFVIIKIQKRVVDAK